MSWLSRFKRRFIVDGHSQKLIDHMSQKWPKIESCGDSTILIDVFDWNPFIYCASHTVQYLSKLTGASIESFSFAGGLLNRMGIPNRRLDKIYNAFSAPLTLRKTNRTSRPFRRVANKLALEVFQKLKTKDDVLNISIENTKIGYLVYDTYLRRQGRPTVDLKDVRLKETIAEAFLNWFIAKDYFTKKNVKAILTSHYVYIEYGILVTIACSLNIPVFIIFNDDDYLLLEINTKTFLQVRNHWEYKKIFSSIEPQIKEQYLMQAKKLLEDRLIGVKDIGTKNYLSHGTPDLSGYGTKSAKPLLKSGGRPRVLVLLNCFFDAPHGYRYLLFSDNWEWLNFLLTHASDTPFDWYVKPHPSGMLANDAIVADFKERFPKINFLERTASNAQVVSEGISSMFTTYGTAGHEFAYMGVPVVTAGDNPHVDYDFNYHPKTREEYLEFIKQAGHLNPNINKNEILEFFSVHYLYSYKPNQFGARLIDPEYKREILDNGVNEPQIFEKFIKGESSDKERRMKSYYDSFFSQYFPNEVAKSRLRPVSTNRNLSEGSSSSV